MHTLILIIMSFLERPCKQDRFICCCVLMAFIINAVLFRGNCAKTLSDKLQRLQNRAVRVLTHSSYDADANQLFKELGWDNLEIRRQKLKAEMVYKSVNGLAPNYLSSKFIQRSDVITSYNLRDSDNKLAIPLPRTNHYKNSFAYSGAVLWNSLPSAARQATSLTNFRRFLINYDTAFM